jgi:hypothetical protein
MLDTGADVAYFYIYTYCNPHPLCYHSCHFSRIYLLQKPEKKNYKKARQRGFM